MEQLKEFYILVKDVWITGFLGINIGRIIITILILIAAFLVRGLFTRFVIGSIGRFVSRTRTTIDDKVLKALDKPIRFIPVILGIYIALEFLSLKGDMAVFAEKIMRSLIVFDIFWALVNTIQPLSEQFRRLETVFTPSMVDWLIKAIRIAFIFIGVVTILEIWGIKIGPILAGLGLLGVAVALGAQDFFKNLISGVLVIAEKRFNPGDWIRVDGEVEGIVESIGFRSTLVRRFDKAPVYVPNSKLSDNAMINFSAMTFRRIYWVIGVEYRTTIEQLRTIRDGIEKFILDSGEFAHPPDVPTFVRIDKFSDSSIDIMVYCFTKTIVWAEWLKLKEDLALHIKQTVENAGTSFAFPSTSVYLEKISTERPEVFVPPVTNKDK
ncbi:MAG: mechanosensitive ion channel family protein [Calditrichaeota bacterium]|nr:mechanosensitive ion channel family protein [Calditrichota bacterium]RQV92764.1 MAG: mechanosensitive ion channel family protein [bacterium]